MFFLSDDTGLPDRDPTQEEMHAIAREVTQDDSLTLADPIWLTHSGCWTGSRTPPMASTA